MPAMTNILIRDDSLVESTLIPVTDTPFPLWKESHATKPEDGKMRVTETLTKLKNGQTKHSIKLEVPILETLGSAGTSAGYVAPQKVAHVPVAITTFFTDRRATDTDRANLLRMHIGLLQGASATTGTGTLAQGTTTGGFLASTLQHVYSIVHNIIPN